MSAADFGIKVSLPSNPVETTSIEGTSIHSSAPPLKSRSGQSSPHHATLSLRFTATITQGINHTLYRFSHGYGYIPFNFAEIVFTSGATSVTGIGYAGIGANLQITANCTADEFLVVIYDNFNWTNSSATLLVSYYVFAENGV